MCRLIHVPHLSEGERSIKIETNEWNERELMKEIILERARSPDASLWRPPSFLSLHRGMEWWRRVLVPWRSLSFPRFSSLSDDEAEELSISFSHGPRPSVSLHLLSFPLRISPVVLYFSPPFVWDGRITCFSNHPSNVIRLKNAAHLAFNHFSFVIWSTLSFSSFVLFYPINKKQPWHFKIKQSLPVLHFHIIQS